MMKRGIRSPTSVIGRVASLGLLLLSMCLGSSAEAAPGEPSAGASDTSTREAVDLALMGAELEYFAWQARRDRAFAGLISLGFAAALVPTGAVVATRGDNESHLVAGGLIAGGALPLLPAVFTLFPSRVEGLEGDFRARLAAGRPASETIRAVEAGWRIAAERNRTSRTYVGIAGLVLGVGALTTSLVFLLAKPGLAGLDETSQYAVGSALLGAGISITTLGLRSLVMQSVEETSWEAYRRTKFASPSLSAWSAPALSVAPVRGGGVALVGVTF
jgi:hypothetical protein